MAWRSQCCSSAGDDSDRHSSGRNGVWFEPAHLPDSMEDGREGDTQEAVKDQLEDLYFSSGKR